MYAYGAYPRPCFEPQQYQTVSRQAYQRSLPSPDQLMSVGHLNPNSAVIRQSLAAGNIRNFGLGINGNPFLPANFNAGAFGQTISANTADRSISNAYNLDRDGIDVDYRRYRPAYYAARWDRNNPGAIYPNYYPYQPYYSGSYEFM